MVMVDGDLVRKVALKYAEDHGWCEVVEQALEELGLGTPKVKKIITLEVEIPEGLEIDWQAAKYDYDGCEFRTTDGEHYIGNVVVPDDVKENSKRVRNLAAVGSRHKFHIDAGTGSSNVLHTICGGSFVKGYQPVSHQSVDVIEFGLDRICGNCKKVDKDL